MRRTSRLLACTIVLALSFNFSFSQVTANFTASATEGCGSLQVSFTDQSFSTAGSITSWSWDLGAPVTSSIQNPGRIYGVPGNYTICLTVTDSEGNSDTECKNDYIKVYELPAPDFVADPPVGCSPLTVNFIDQSTSANGSIEEWIWGIGGTTGVVVDDGSLPAITSTYTNPDEYTISLTVTDDKGCINTITKNNYVIVSDDPVVDVSAPVTFSCTNPFIVNFTNNGNTTDMDFQWDFGNGTFFNGPHPPAVVYDGFGSYTITVIGTNTITGCSDTQVLTDYIQVGYPIEFSASSTFVCDAESVSFMDNSPDPAQSVLWEFGDGNTSTAANPTHVYPGIGCYTVTLTRTVNGCTAFDTLDCVEIVALPTVSYSNDNSIGCTTPHTVQFTSNSASAVQWLWNFGDGTTSEEANPVHIYENYGNFPVELRVWNIEGCRQIINTESILVQAIEAVIPQDTTKGCSPLDVTLTNTSTSPTPITSYEWTLTNNSSSPPVIESSTSPSPDFVLVDTGFYQIQLIVTNDIGCRDTLVEDDLIAVGIPPEMAFTADPLVSCVETPISFVAQTSDNANNWVWDFGDGGLGYGAIPEHEYLDTGYFDVTLLASHHECENELTIDSFIQITPPIARFDISSDCTTPFLREMIDQSVGADSVFWDFGVAGIETDTSSERNPSFTYPFTGDFNITMTVFNFETGCSDDVSQFIMVRDINADFGINSALEGCEPFEISIDDNSQDADIYNWAANGAIILDPTVPIPSITYLDPGKFTDVELIVTDVNGCQDTVAFQDTITVNEVFADFTIAPTDGCQPLTVSFTDNSSSVFGTVTEWIWHFDEGAPVSNEQNPNVVFEEIGSYRIVLTAIDDWGCEDVAIIDDGVQVTFPLVSFNSDTLSCTSRQISFNNTSVGEAMSYLWDFGDGQTSTANNPTHLYTNEGVYTVCLTATDVNGCDSTLCKSDYIVIADPVAAFTSDTTYTTCPPLIVNFENQSLHADQYTWDFGNASGTSNLENPPHIYTEPGVFDVSLIASFGGFCADTLVLDDYIQVEGPVGSFSFDIDSACIPATITFYGESIDYYNYIWDFGNGDLDTTLNVINDTIQYEYDLVGKFIPKLILEDFNLCRRAFESPDTIQLEELNLNFVVSDPILCTGEDNTTFLNTSSSSLPITSVEWIVEGGNPSTSSFFEPTVTYDSAGVFDVILISTNGFCTDTLIRPEAVKVGETPVAAFSMSDTLGCPPFPVTFTDLSTVGTGFISGWTWDYGDGDSSFVQNPTHVFDQGDQSTVTLTVSTDIGCIDEISNVVELFPMPVVEAPEPYNICIGNVATLAVNILSDPTDLTYYWIDDPTLSCTTCLNPDATPADTTTYYFVVNNPIGCSDTTEVLVEVRPFPAPVVTITNDTTICANSVIQIVADGGNNIYEYQWDTSSPGLTCYENCFNPIATPEVSTTYIVTVTNEFGCETIEDVFIEVIDESQPFAGPDRTICEGNSTQLDIQFGNDHTWLVTEGLNCTYCPDPIANPETTTTYVVTAITDIGCEVRDTITINVMSEESIDAGMDNVICRGEQIELDGLGSGQISWTPAASLSDPNVINPIASPTSTTTYRLSITNDECMMTDSVTIEVVDRAEVYGDDATICLGESVELNAYGSAQEFSWTPALSLNNSEIANPIATPTETTTYVVTGSLGTCQDATAEITVTVVPGPPTNLTRVYDFFPGQTVEVEVTTDGMAAYSYEWSPVELLSCVSCNNPQITPDSTTMLTVTVTDPVTNCWTIDTTLLRRQNNCPPDLIGVPNIFTPNNDGINDVLDLHLSPAIQATGIEVFRIYDRWGAQIFEGRNANDVWDGTFKGKALPSGVYVYYIEAPCPVGEGKIMKKGDITLLRK